MIVRKLLLATVLGVTALTGSLATADTPPVSKPPATKSDAAKKYTLLYRKADEVRWHRVTGLTATALKEKQAEFKKKRFLTQVRSERPRKPPK